MNALHITPLNPPTNFQTKELMMSSHQNLGSFNNVNNNRVCMKPRISTNRYFPYKKPDLCINFQRGNCNYGDNCRFAHTLGPLAQKPLPRFENPSYSYNTSMSKQRLCWTYFNGGQCLYGDRCHFSHDTSIRNSVVNRGGASGDAAAKNHYQVPVGVKTRLCKKWMENGSCPYGFRCIFAHGEAELRKSENVKVSAYVTTPKQQVVGKQWVFKWTDIAKTSRIYADWIEDTPLVEDPSDTMQNEFRF